MLVHLSFDHLIAQPGQPLPIPVEVFNDSDVIGGYSFRALGLDQDWVDVVPGELTLFPDSSATVMVTVTIPDDLPAGDRVLSLEVTQQNAPRHSVIHNVTLTVTPERSGRTRLEPVTATGGKETTFSLTLTNTGNKAIDAEFSWADEEDKLWMAFEPPYVQLGAGQETTIDVEVIGKRPLVGAPAPRAFTITTDGFDLPESTHGVFIQKPYVPRGALALFGLLLAIVVFAGVITAALSRIVDNGRADAQLAVEVLEAADRAAISARPGEVTGLVSARAGGDGQSGVAVAAFAPDDANNAVATTATNGSGAYRLAGLPPGEYLLRFEGAGFAQQWYDGVFDPGDATPVVVPDGAGVSGIDASLGGTPGSIAGTVVGDDPAGGVVEVAVLLSEEITFDEAGVPDGSDLALFRTVPVAEDGTFLIENLPSPLHYALTLKKEQYADSLRLVELGGGEQREGVVLALRRGDGEITGQVIDSAGNPLGGATVTATTSTTTFTTMSLTPTAQRGSFALRNLPSPGLYTVTVSLAGYADSTVAVALDAGGTAPPSTVVLDTSRSSIRGSVTANGAPLGGVSVVATDGEQSFTTISETAGGPGTFLLADLPSPATYSITFSREGYRSVTRSVATQPGADPPPLSVAMAPATGVLEGVVSEIPLGESTPQPLGNVKVVVSSGSATYTGYSATSGPSGANQTIGFYRIAGIPPGTYSAEFSQPGRQSVVALVTIEAAQTTRRDVTLRQQASIFGTVHAGATDGPPAANITVRLYRSSQFPTTALATRTSGSDGSYDFRGLDAPEDYIITFARPFEAEETSVSVTGLEQGERRQAPIAVVASDT